MRQPIIVIPKSYKSCSDTAEHYIYGSSRLGIHQTKKELRNRYKQEEIFIPSNLVNTTALYRGKRNYELSNHLGNVNMVISDKRKSVCDAELGVEYFVAEVLSAVDYYPFGMMMPDRQWYAGSDSSSYSFGFNGQEKDDEVSGIGNTISYTLRIYDSRLGRFLSMDPLTQEFPFYSPYQFAGNCPIKFIDLDGAEPYGPAYPAAGTPHLRYNFTPATEYGRDRKGNFKKYYKTAQAWDCSPSGLAAANRQNAQNNGQGTLVDGYHHNAQSAKQWQLVDGGAPASININTNTNTQTEIYNGNLGNNAAGTTNRSVTIPSGDAVTSASFSYNNGVNEGNSYLITDATTGAVLATVPTTTGAGTINIPVVPVQTINIQQDPAPGVAGSSTDVWNYSLFVTVTQQTTTITTIPSSQPTVSSPGVPITPPPPTVNTSSSTSTTTNTSNSTGQ